MVWVIAFGELFFGDLWCVVWGYGGMRTHFSLLNPPQGAILQDRALIVFRICPIIAIRSRAHPTIPT